MAEQPQRSLLSEALRDTFAEIIHDDRFVGSGVIPWAKYSTQVGTGWREHPNIKRSLDTADKLIAVMDTMGQPDEVA